VLSKPYMLGFDVRIEDIKLEILDSMYHIGLIYELNDDEKYERNYIKAAAIFQYCAKFAEK